MENPKIPSPHYEILAYLAASPEGRLYRLPGGFWVTDTTTNPNDWCTDITVIKRMETAGLLKKTRQEYEITEEGLKALREKEPLNAAKGNRGAAGRPLWT